MEYTITTPVEGFTGMIAGVAFANGQGATADPNALAYFRRHGYGIDLAEPATSEAAATSEASDDPPEPPAQSALKAEWVDYAVAQGANRDEADALTKPDLVEKYG